MKHYLLLLVALSFLKGYAQVDTAQQQIAGRSNSPEHYSRPYVILISADGFRYDYAEKYAAGNLLELSKKGVRANSMIPSFPSKTFPNHYSLVTGMHPAHHGLISNSFYDPSRETHYRISDRKAVQDERWYGGIPLWVLAEQQQMLSASFYWVGSEAPVKGLFPSYFYMYNEVIDTKERIKAVVDWLSLPEEKRPHLITFYLPEVDHAGHAYGPESEEVKEAVLFVDDVIMQLNEAIAPLNLPVNYIFVSDHGMTTVDTLNTLDIPAELLDCAKCTLVKSDVILQAYFNNQEDILTTYDKLKGKDKGYKIYLKRELPAHLHFGPEDDDFGRIGDIVILADWPKIFHYGSGKISPGHHGYDPLVVKEMEAIFYAWGPNLKTNLSLPPIHVVDVYDIVTKILNISYTHETDGSKDLSTMILKEE